MMTNTLDELAIAVIDANGGSTALAKKIGLPDKSGAMTVNNWRTRGLPWWFKAKHPDLIKSTIKQLNKVAA